MNHADFINGIYETIGGILLFLNCYRLYKDKEVKGVSLATCGFFASWGYWNLYFYPFYGAWLSTIGAAILTVANTIWIVMAIYYTFIKK